MAQSSKYRKPVKRTCKLLYGRTLAMTFVYEDGKAEADAYEIREIGSDCGRGFRLTKTTTEGEGLDARIVRGNTYECHLAGDGQQSCGCKGFAFRGTCRHVEAIRSLIDMQVISGGYPGAEQHDEAVDAY